MARPKEFAPMVNWLYDLVLWSFSILIDLFFREVHPRGSFRIPRRGPVIFVAAPHANQFVDPLILMRVVRLEAKRRIAFLVAEKSMRRRFIGALSRSVGALPVARALDMTKPATGRIFLPDLQDLTKIKGIGTKFTKELQPGGLLVLPPVTGKAAASAEVAEVISDEEAVLKKEFKEQVAFDQLTYDGDDGRGSKYKVAPKVDQTQVYNAVFGRLNAGGCVGIFPEGGSHDRTELLPLKAGVAIMALGALAANPDCGLKIVPCGMNYFHAHKFRSRAVVEFGVPLDVPAELVEQYRRGERREAVKTLLGMIYNALVSVTVTSPDYETLMVIQAARRLYKAYHKKLPLPTVMELNRRLVTGYLHFKDDPRVIQLRKNVAEYNGQLRLLALRDHQVEYAKFGVIKVLATIVYRVLKMFVMGAGALPGAILFSPVFIATKQISKRKAAEALKASTVKIEGRDVMATWKLLVALAFAPIVYNFYVVITVILTYKNRFFGLIPESVPPWAVVFIGWVVFPAITFMALRFGEVGMDVFKSLRPLFLCLNPSSANTLVKLRKRREELSAEVTDVINTLGPELFEDFNSWKIVKLPGVNGADTGDESEKQPQYGLTYTTEYVGQQYNRNNSSRLTRRDSEQSNDTEDTSSEHENFHDLAKVPIFPSRPVSRAGSISNSSKKRRGFLKPSQPHLDDEDEDDVKRKIGKAMAERGKRRGWNRRRSNGSEEFDGEADEDGEGEGAWESNDEVEVMEAKKEV